MFETSTLRHGVCVLPFRLLGLALTWEKPMRARWIVSTDTETPHSSCCRMIRSHACQRTTPWTAAIGPFSTRRTRNRLCSSVSLQGPPGDGLFTTLSGLLFPGPAASDVPFRPFLCEAPSSIAAIASSRRACAAFADRVPNRSDRIRVRLARARQRSAVKLALGSRFRRVCRVADAAVKC
jgi:hypothetical protein